MFGGLHNADNSILATNSASLLRGNLKIILNSTDVFIRYFAVIERDMETNKVRRGDCWNSVSFLLLAFRFADCVLLTVKSARK